MLKNIKLEMDFNPITLIFKDKAREKEYTYFRYLYKSNITKTFLLVFAIVYFTIFIVDFFLLDISSYLIISVKALISVLALVFYFVFRKISFVKQTQYTVAFISLVFASIMLQALYHPGTENVNVYMIGYSIVVYSTYFLIGIKLKDSFIVNMIAQVVFYSLLIYLYPTQANFIVYFLLLQANLVFLYSAYHLESSNRQLFYYINKLETENEKQVKLYNILSESNNSNNVKDEFLSEEKIDFKDDNEIDVIVDEQTEFKRRNNILIVDDEKDNMLYFEQVALKLRLNLFKAKNGLDAVSLYKKYQSDIALVLMDIRMPEMNGCEATKEIKKINKNIPVILISAYTEEINDDNEADLVLSKPISPQKLSDAIKSFTL